MDYLPGDLSLCLGIDGLKKVQLRGWNFAISGSAETIWTLGGTYARLSSAVAMEIVSGSANDTAAGTGARTVQVSGLNGSYLPFTETLTMNGITPVALVNTLAIAINSVKVLTAGSGLTNAGAISVRTVSGSTVKRQIVAASGQNLSVGQDADFLYTIPDGYIGVIKKINFSTFGGTGNIYAWLNTHSEAGIIRGEGQSAISVASTSLNQGFGSIDFGSGLVLPSKYLLELRAYASAGAGEFSALAEMYLINKSGWIWGTGGA